jgi:hypothetical protein
MGIEAGPRRRSLTAQVVAHHPDLSYPGIRRRCRGAVAQLGERLNGIQEVGGSTPLSSTFRVLRG